ncbi:hypothetical protein D3C75_1168130 [compost metagenome]
MNEAFDFNINMLLDLGDLFQAGLTAQHDTRQAFFFPEGYGLPVQGRLLGT